MLAIMYNVLYNAHKNVLYVTNISKLLSKSTAFWQAKMQDQRDTPRGNLYSQLFIHSQKVRAFIAFYGLLSHWSQLSSMILCQRNETTNINIQKFKTFQF